MQQEAIKNLALDRINSHRVVMTMVAEKPDPRNVASQKDVPVTTRPKDMTKEREKRNTWKMIGISVGVALLLVVAIKSKWIKL